MPCRLRVPRRLDERDENRGESAGFRRFARGGAGIGGKRSGGRFIGRGGADADSTRFSLNSRGDERIEYVVDKIEANSVIQQLIADMILLPHASIPSLYTYTGFHVSPFEIPEGVSSSLQWNFPLDYFFQGMSRILQQDQIFVIPKIGPIMV